MLQTEARPPAENRYGGAPKGARPSAAEGRRVPRKHPARRVMCGPTGCRRIRAPVGAPPTPRRWDSISPPGRHRAAGTLGLFDK